MNSPPDLIGIWASRSLGHTQIASFSNSSPYVTLYWTMNTVRGNYFPLVMPPPYKSGEIALENAAGDLDDLTQSFYMIGNEPGLSHKWVTYRFPLNGPVSTPIKNDAPAKFDSQCSSPPGLRVVEAVFYTACVLLANQANTIFQTRWPFTSPSAKAQPSRSPSVGGITIPSIALDPTNATGPTITWGVLDFANSTTGRGPLYLEPGN